MAAKKKTSLQALEALAAVASTPPASPATEVVAEPVNPVPLKRGGKKAAPKAADAPTSDVAIADTSPDASGVRPAAEASPAAANDNVPPAPRAKREKKAAPKADPVAVRRELFMSARDVLELALHGNRKQGLTGLDRLDGNILVIGDPKATRGHALPTLSKQQVSVLLAEPWENPDFRDRVKVTLARIAAREYLTASEARFAYTQLRTVQSLALARMEMGGADTFDPANLGCCRVLMDAFMQLHDAARVCALRSPREGVILNTLMSRQGRGAVDPFVKKVLAIDSLKALVRVIPTDTPWRKLATLTMAKLLANSAELLPPSEAAEALDNFISFLSHRIQEMEAPIREAEAARKRLASEAKLREGLLAAWTNLVAQAEGYGLTVPAINTETIPVEDFRREMGRLGGQLTAVKARVEARRREKLAARISVLMVNAALLDEPLTLKEAEAKARAELETEAGRKQAAEDAQAHKAEAIAQAAADEDTYRALKAQETDLNRRRAAVHKHVAPQGTVDRRDLAGSAQRIDSLLTETVEAEEAARKQRGSALAAMVALAAQNH